MNRHRPLMYGLAAFAVFLLFIAIGGVAIFVIQPLAGAREWPDSSILARLAAAVVLAVLLVIVLRKKWHEPEGDGSHK